VPIGYVSLKPWMRKRRAHEVESEPGEQTYPNKHSACKKAYKIKQNPYFEEQANSYASEMFGTQK
jgi:hypothetical protein